MARILTAEEAQKKFETPPDLGTKEWWTLWNSGKIKTSLPTGPSSDKSSVDYSQMDNIVKQQYRANNLKTLQDLTKTGALKLTDYYKLSNQILEDYNKTKDTIKTYSIPKIQGSKADYDAWVASGKKTNLGRVSTSGQAYETAMNSFDAPLQGLTEQMTNGAVVPKLPFTQAEYLSLPKELLPTKEDVDKGTVPFDILPMGRINAPETPTATIPPPTAIPTTTTTGGAPTTVTAPLTGGSPVPTGTPLTEDYLAQALAKQAEQFQTSFADQRKSMEDYYKNVLPGLYLPAGTPTTTPEDAGPPPVSPSLDQQRLDQLAQQEKENYINALNEAIKTRETGLSQYGQAVAGIEPAMRGALTEALGRRKSSFQELSDALIAEENRRMMQETPAMLEDLNSRGLLRSSALGEALARERSNLTGETANKLAALGANTADVESQGLYDIAKLKANTQSDLAQRALGITDDYASGRLGTTSYGQELNRAGLQREFSLADWQKEAELAAQLGSQVTPQVQDYSSNGLSGLLAGAGTGAMIGNAITPGIGAGYGAAIGGVTGLIGTKQSSGGVS